jgi:CRISPR-associated Csh1 family protein
MLRPVALLGGAVTDDPLKGIVDRTKAENVFVIRMDENCHYLGLAVENNEGEGTYLYKREKGGLPGKFITGRIGGLEMTKLKKNLQKFAEDPTNRDLLSILDEFKEKKIAWVRKPSILRDSNVLGKIPPGSRQLLRLVVEEIVSHKDTIMKDIGEKVLQGDYGEILLTVKVGGKYPRDIEGFPELLQIASQGLPSSISTTNTTNNSITPICSICNSPAATEKLKEPLPFFTIDKPNFIPDGIRDNHSKVFPLCRKCYLNVQRGSKYIQENLSFSIPNTSGRERLWIWIIPQLDDPVLVEEFLKRKSDKGLESFKEMISLSQGMDVAREMDLSKENEVSVNLTSFLTYVAVYHFYDQQKNMRLIGSTDSIYPSRLKELGKEKRVVDAIAFKNNNPFRFFFGSIIDFLEKDSEGWMKAMAHIMSSVFSRQQLDEILIAKLLLEPSKSLIAKRELKQFEEKILRATLILEFLHRVNTLSMIGQTRSSPLPVDAKAVAAANFLNSHAGILYNKNLRAICSVGIAVGVIIKVQKRYLGSDSFISRLNRLEMDYTRLLGLFPQAFIKLKHYEAFDDYEGLFTYLGNEEISNLDFKQKLPKELMNLVFAIGMTQGFSLSTTNSSEAL